MLGTLFVFSNGFETVENDSLVLDHEVSARMTARGALKIVERLSDGTDRTIYDASAPTETKNNSNKSSPPSVVLTEGADEMSPAPIHTDSMADPSASAPVTGFSEFGDGKQITDESATARIHALHTALASDGIKIDTSEQLYATGTRMAQIGYATQSARKQEHDESLPIRDVADALRAQVMAEDREDYTISAREFGKNLAVNGHVTVKGYKVSEQAIRGLMLRLESPALGYVLGLRDRISAEYEKPENLRDSRGIATDRVKIADILSHECERNPSVKMKMRTRKGIGDIFAIVSPQYAPADAPAVLADIVAKMPRDARGTFAYDPKSTAWELRADVWTPTPVESQAVGEPFRGYVSFQSKDNGTGRFRGGGGIELIRCLNASTYLAEGAAVARRHIGAIMVDIDAMLVGATRSIHALCKAWGANRELEIPLPEIKEKKITLEDAIPGFWRFLLRDQRSELARVLPGRTENHIVGLTNAFNRERRDSSKLVRADFAQGWTRYIQRQAGDVRREAEIACGSWIVNDRPMGYVAE
jgi:hypothetical protein